MTPFSALIASLGQALQGGEDPLTHTVQRGDSLGKIAKQKGVSVQDLMRMNDIANPNHIEVGQNLQFGETRGANLFGNLATSLNNLKESYATPAKTLMRYMAGGSAPVTREDLSEEALAMLANIAGREGRDGKVDSYTPYHNRGGGYMAGRTNPDAKTTNRAADELAYTIGRFFVDKDGEGNTYIRDAFDFHDPEERWENAKARWEKGAYGGAVSSTLQMIAPLVRRMAMASLGQRGLEEGIPVAIKFTPEEMRQYR